MKLSARPFVALFAIAVVALGSISLAEAQGTENIPMGFRTKEFELRGTPPTDTQPVINPDQNGAPPGLPPQTSLNVPEPGTTVLLLLGAGLAAGAALRRRAARR